MAAITIILKYGKGLLLNRNKLSRFSLLFDNKVVVNYLLSTVETLDIYLADIEWNANLCYFVRKRYKDM